MENMFERTTVLHSTQNGLGISIPPNRYHQKQEISRAWALRTFHTHIKPLHSHIQIHPRRMPKSTDEPRLFPRRSTYSWCESFLQYLPLHIHGHHTTDSESIKGNKSCSARQSNEVQAFAVVPTHAPRNAVGIGFAVAVSLPRQRSQIT